jgi:hypothetical protein
MLGRKVRAVLLLLIVPLLVACKPSPDKEEMGAAGLTGIDHLADHLSVQDFSMNGHGGTQAGKGGSTVCCASLPLKWRPDLTAVVRWNVTNWRDCFGENFETVVPVERYEELGHIWVHFLSDGSVRVLSSNEGPRSQTYPGPHDVIPQKEPWDVYPLLDICKAKAERSKNAQA